MRTLTTAFKNALNTDTLRPIYLVHLEFGASTNIYLNDRAANFTWDSKTWLGSGFLRPIRSIEEAGELRAVGCEITLTGAVAELVALSLNEARLSNKGRVYLGLLNSDEAIIDTPYLLFAGYLDVPVITYNETEVTLSLQYENDLMNLRNAGEFRYTEQSQRAIYGDDLGFQYVPLMESWNGYWGKAERPKWLKPKRRS